MSLPCRCPCDELRCADPARFRAASEAEQVGLVAEIGCVALALGGESSPRRARLLQRALRLLPGMGQLTEPALDRLLSRAAAHSAEGGVWLCEATHRIRSPALKRVAFRLAVLLCAAEEGAPNAMQEELLLALACGFGFNERETTELVVRAAGWQATP